MAWGGPSSERGRARGLPETNRRNGGGAAAALRTGHPTRRGRGVPAGTALLLRVRVQRGGQRGGCPPGPERKQQDEEGGRPAGTGHRGEGSPAPGRLPRGRRSHREARTSSQDPRPHDGPRGGQGRPPAHGSPDVEARSAWRPPPRPLLPPSASATPRSAQRPAGPASTAGRSPRPRPRARRSAAPAAGPPGPRPPGSARAGTGRPPAQAGTLPPATRGPSAPARPPARLTLGQDPPHPQPQLAQLHRLPHEVGLVAAGSAAQGAGARQEVERGLQQRHGGPRRARGLGSRASGQLSNRRPEPHQLPPRRRDAGPEGRRPLTSAPAGRRRVRRALGAGCACAAAPASRRTSGCRVPGSPHGAGRGRSEQWPRGLPPG